jgi:hypothetical protein
MNALKRAILPVVVFVVVAGAHYTWAVTFSRECQNCSSEEECAAASPLQAYIQTQSYWLGMSYGLSLSFAAYALQRYRERRMCAARTVAVGGVTLTGVLAVVGCYLAGCCGSPMLAVYLSLFGAAFLPWAKPLIAVLTVIMIAAAWLWMRRRERLQECCDSKPVEQPPA